LQYQPASSRPQTKQRLYEKDLDFSYKPFLSILGTGLVTANGAHWQKQRLLMGPALRIDMLDAIIPIAKTAVDRLCAQLEAHRGSGTPGEPPSQRCGRLGPAAGAASVLAGALPTPV
jgi:cytochrome P450